jgi:hypothetical protein
MSKITARVTENGNGLPNIGELCYDASTDSVYRVVAWDGTFAVDTHKRIDVQLEYVGSSETCEWVAIEAGNYGVSVSE